MKRRVMEPFRAPRSVGQAMKRQVIKETQPKEVSPAKAKGVGKTVSAKASSERRRSPMPQWVIASMAARKMVARAY